MISTVKLINSIEKSVDEDLGMIETQRGIAKTKTMVICVAVLACAAFMLPIMNANAVTYRRLYICQKCYSIMASSTGWTRITSNLYYLNYSPDGVRLRSSSFTSVKVYNKYTRLGAGSNLDLIKAVTYYLYKLPSSWKPGARVMSSTSIPSGTVVAVFTNGVYSGHVAVFAGFTSGRTGFKVFDQNWKTTGSLYGCIGKHDIYKTGSGLSDADNYYIVLAPYS
jgi:hypothetical protein